MQHETPHAHKHPASEGVPTGQAALDAMAGELSALDEALVGIYNLDALFASTTVLGSIAQIAPHMPDMARLFDFDIKHAERLPIYAHALIHSNALVLAHSPATSSFDELAVEARAVREIFLPAADVLVSRGVVAKKTVDDIRAGQGNRDLIEDVSTLHVILSSHGNAGLVADEYMATGAKLVAELPGAYAQPDASPLAAA